jgi:hypothetical protein
MRGRQAHNGGVSRRDGMPDVGDTSFAACAIPQSFACRHPSLTDREVAMNPGHIPLALALALSIGLVASACTRQESPARAAEDASAHTTHAADAGVADADADASHADHAAVAGNDDPMPAGHVPWTPDAPLVEGMSRVRTALAALEGKPDAATVQARATDVDEAVKYMFANCKLESAPDAALHSVLARLMIGSQALHADPANTAPAADMHAAVAEYERLFADPGKAGAGAS